MQSINQREKWDAEEFEGKEIMVQAVVPMEKNNFTTWHDIVLDLLFHLSIYS